MTFPKERPIADACFPKGRTYSPPRSGGSALLRRQEAMIAMTKGGDVL